MDTQLVTRFVARAKECRRDAKRYPALGFISAFTRGQASGYLLAARIAKGTRSAWDRNNVARTMREAA